MSKSLNLFIPITKVDASKRLVYGTIASETLDKANEVFDYATSKPHFEKWSGDIAKSTDGKSMGNVRAMHGHVAAGKLTDIAFDDANQTIEGCAKIIDDAEWNKVLEGVYTGFSMGGKYEKRWKEGDFTRYTASPVEVSLVDLPCIPDATFSVIKADGSVEMRKFHVVDVAKAAELPVGNVTEVVEASHDDYEQVWMSKMDGSTHKKKADMLAHNEALKKAAADTALLVDDPVLAKLKEIKTVLDAKTAVKKVNALIKRRAPTGDWLAKKQDVKKEAAGLSYVAYLVQLLDQLESAEDAYEYLGGDKALSDRFGSLVVELGDLTAELLNECLESSKEEEACEAMMAQAAKSLSLIKAVYGAKDQASLQAAHDHLASMGAECVDSDSDDSVDDVDGMERAAKTQELNKALTAERDALSKKVEAILPMLDEVLARVKNIEEQPAVPNVPSRLTVVEKTADNSEMEASINKMSPDEVQKMLATLAIKLAHQNPRSITNR